MGYDHYTVPNDCSCRTYFFLFSFSTRKRKSVASRAIFSNFFVEEWTKTTHNTSRDCRVHFFQQAFSKQLYIIIMTRRAAPLYKRSEIGVADCYSTICLVLLCWKHEQKYNN